MRWFRSISIAVVLGLLVACGSGSPAVGSSAAVVVRPTTNPTPVPPSTATVPVTTPTLAATDSPDPSPTAPKAGPTEETATALAEATATTADGPVTSSMAELQITGERYAALGDPEAPITIVEFSDFGCPFCRLYELNTFPEIKARYIDTGKVYYVYKDYPIVSEQGGIAAEAAACAGDQGRYWEMHDRLFQAPKEWQVAPEQAYAIFARYANDLGIDGEMLQQCVASGSKTPEVERDFQQGLTLGLQGTPAFIINGKLLSGAQPLEVFIDVLDNELGTS